MRRSTRSANTFTAIFLNIILIIQALLVLYPIAFTISSAFSKADSLNAVSIVPFPSEIRRKVVTVEQQVLDWNDEPVFDEEGNPVMEEVEDVARDANGDPIYETVYRPSLYQFRRLLTGSQDQVKGAAPGVHGTNYLKWYGNTLKIAIMNTILTVIICSTAGYVFSRFKFPFKKPIMAGMIILQMFPSFIGMIATYVILWKLNALNTHWGLVLVYATGNIPYNSWLMKGYYDTVSKDIAEAAYVDGCTPFQTYVKIILPTVKPQLVFLTLTSFTGPWMDFIFPKLILRSDDKKTLAVGLYEMINGQAANNYTMFAAGALLVAIPFVIIFLAGQKQLLISLAGTSGKE